MCEPGIFSDSVPASPAITAIAASWAGAIGANSLLVGYNKNDRTDEPERYAKAPEVHKLLSELISATTARKFKIATPYWDTPKPEIIKRALELAVPLEVTWTCWKGGTVHCGVCAGCIGRKENFKAAGLKDVVYDRQE